MTAGPGKYDAEATMVREATNADAVVVIVIGGDRGAGFTIQGPPALALILPKLLRDIAERLDADLEAMGDAQ